jgi:translation initiation factor IF-2
MAKIRIYELAKDLRMDNKDLVRQLIEMGYDVRNHMSTLTSDEALEVREKISHSRSEVVEEKRVKPTVIRRRRKRVEAAEEAEVPAEAEAAEEPAEAAAEAAEAVSEAAEAAEAAVEAVAETVEPTPEAEEAPAQEAQPEAPDAEAAPPEAEAETVEPAPEAEEAPAAPLEAAPQEAETALEAAESQTEDLGREEAAEAEPQPAEEAPAQPKPKRRLKENEPARIISKPAQPVQPTPPPPPPRPAPPSRRPSPAAEMAPPPGPPPGKADEGRRRRKKKGKGGQAIPDNEFLVSQAKSRRKEILDKEALYDRSVRGRKRGAAPKRPQKTAVTQPKAIKRRIKVAEAITVGELAKRMGVKAAEMVGRLMKQGMMVTLNQSLDVEEATLVAAEFGFGVDKVGFEEHDLLDQAQDKPEDLVGRPPVVTIMGHVDHGKTSLLDAIRKSKVVDGEAGGITQHIGAYNVGLEDGGRVVFVDTPGHEAFTQMRARGAQVTDVVVLVVAADDGVMDQTREAINHSRAAEVPIMVAINKVDKAGADPDRVKRELAEMELVPEDWGGDTIMVEVSAKSGQGVDTLLEMLELQSELLELTANPTKPARGHILEARLDKGRGPVATVLVQEGTLRNGAPFVCGVYAGKVRAMFDDTGSKVEVQGLGGVPEAGDDFAVVESDKDARQIAEHRAQKKREAELSQAKGVSLEGFFDQMKEGEVRELKLVIKADVQGSVEAVVDAVGKLGNEQVKVDVIHSATGAITESDVMLAAASEAIIIGFNVRPAGKVAETAEQERVDIRTYDVIYQILDDVTAALTGMLAPVLEEDVIGRVEVRDTFGVPKVGTVAGCYVTSGKVERGAQARLLRDGAVVTTARISSLRRFKEDVKEVAQGYECGMGLENYNDIKIGDEIEIFVTREVAPEL